MRNEGDGGAEGDEEGRKILIPISTNNKQQFPLKFW